MRKLIPPRTHDWFVAACLALAALAASASPSNKWRLEVSGGAESDGTIVLRVSPEGGEALESKIEVANGTGENSVAKVLVRVLRADLPKEVYRVERDDGELHQRFRRPALLSVR